MRKEAGKTETTGPEYCLVCGLPQSLRLGQPCIRCGVPFGSIMDPNDATCSHTLPGASLGSVALESKRLSPRVSNAEYLKGWNWGAAHCSVFWAFRHRLFGIGVACLLNLALWVLIVTGAVFSSSIPGELDTNDLLYGMIGAAIGLCSVTFWFCKTIYLGIAGYRLAKNSGRYTDDPSMIAALKSWNRLGGTVGIVAIILVITVVIWSAAR